MVDQQRGVALLQRRRAGQPHWRATFALHEQLFQRLRTQAVARLRFQHHAVLAGLGEDGGNLPLAEGVVQRIGDVRDLDTQARRRVAIDVQ